MKFLFRRVRRPRRTAKANAKFKMHNAKLTQGVTLSEANGSLGGTHCTKILHCVQNDNFSRGDSRIDRLFGTYCTKRV